MKYIVDTCGWIEWLHDGELAGKFKAFLEDCSNLIVPTIIQYELYKWTYKKIDEATAYDIISYTAKCEVISLDSTFAIEAAEISNNFNLTMADAIVYTTALKTKSLLITCDKHFEKLANVRYFKK